MTTSKPPCEASTVVEEALLSGASLRDVCRSRSKTPADARALEARVARRLARKTSGACLGELLLKKNSPYLLGVATLLCCRPDDVDALLLESGASATWIAEQTGSGKRGYHFWYTRLQRAARRAGRVNGKLTSRAQAASPANPAFAGGYNFFSVDTHELFPDRSPL